MIPAAAHDDIRGKLRGLLIALGDQLPPSTTGLIDELLDANEQGVALEILTEMLAESHARISADEIAVVEDLVTRMKLDGLNVGRLRPLVVDDGGAR